MSLTWDYLVGDVREVLRERPADSVHTIVTSPPYWGLRDYGIPPSIWGGDPECEHEWGEERTITKDRQHLKELGERLGCGGGDKHSCEGMDASQGVWCQHCGAWRGCLGLEPTPELFIEHMVEVGAEMWRVLRDDGTLFLNLGDCYCTVPHGTANRNTPIVERQTCPECGGPVHEEDILVCPDGLMPHLVCDCCGYQWVPEGAYHG